jgi:lambda family phage portal protein
MGWRDFFPRIRSQVTEGSGSGNPLLDLASQALFRTHPQRPQGLDAASYGRRLGLWQPMREHVNALLVKAGETTIARTRYVVRNNGYARAAVRSWTAATVGAGIRPSPLIEDNKLKAAVAAAFQDWTDESDVENVTDFYGIQRRVAREVFMAGECFVHIINTSPADDKIPLRLQVLPSEQLPVWKNATAPVTNNPIRMGVEFDNLTKKRVAYWFWIRDPTDIAFSFAFIYNHIVRIPADEILHIYDPVEAGQIRGLSGFAAAVVKMFMLDLYDDAELERKKQAARFAGFIKNPPVDLATDPDMKLGVFDAELPPYFGPGAFLEMNSGQDIQFSEPADVGPNYDAFQYRTLLQLAAALGVPYAEISSDLAKASYASSRAGLLAFRAEVEAFQHAVMVYQFLRPVYQRWFAKAVLAGALPVTATQLRNTPAVTRFKAMTPKMPWVDPLKDTQAEALAVQNGFKARSDVIEAQGYDAEETDARIAADRAREQELNLTFVATTKVPPAPALQMPLTTTGGQGEPTPADEQAQHEEQQQQTSKEAA